MPEEASAEDEESGRVHTTAQRCTCWCNPGTGGLNKIERKMCIHRRFYKIKKAKSENQPGWGEELLSLSRKTRPGAQGQDSMCTSISGIHLREPKKRWTEIVCIREKAKMFSARYLPQRFWTEDLSTVAVDELPQCLEEL